jgi:hypothetical protein
MTSQQYLAANEEGLLTPDLLREFYKIDPTNAMRILKQKQAAGDTDYIADFMEILSSEPGTENTSSGSGYKAVSQAIDGVIGAEDDDGFLEGAAKGIADAVVGAPVRSGAAIADYGTAAVNELFGNEGRLQMEDTPDFLDFATDVAETGLTAATAGAYAPIRSVGQNLIKQGVKPTLKKIGDRYVSKTPGFVKKAGGAILKSPTARTAAVLGGFGGLNALDNDSEIDDIRLPNKPSPTLEDINEPLPSSDQAYNSSAVSLENPDPVQGAASNTSSKGAREAAATQPTSMRPDKSRDTLTDLLNRRMQNEAIRKTENEIAADKKSDRLAAEEAHRASVRAESPEYAQIESLYDSTGGRKKGAFAKLSQQQRDDAFRQFNLNRSAANNKRARIQSILDDEDDKHIAAGKPGPLPSQGFMFANEEDSFFNDGSVSRKVFEDRNSFRKPSLEEPAAPEAPEAPEDSGMDFEDYLKMGAFLGGGALLSRTNPGRKMLRKGLDMFGKGKNYPPGRDAIYKNAVARNAQPGTLKSVSGLGQPGSMPKVVKTPGNVGNPSISGGLGHPSQPSFNRADFISGAASGSNMMNRVNNMPRSGLIKNLGGPRTRDNKRVATTEELRRQYLLKSLDNI